MINRRRRLAFAVLAVAASSGCSGPASPAAQTAVALQPVVTVYKTATCSCCDRWARHMADHGFVIQTRVVGDMREVRSALGVPERLRSCHTAAVDGYIVEGHVPAGDVKRLLSERPAARGIAAPGMATGSPGMEYGDRKDPYDVVLFTGTGDLQVFAKH